MVRLPVGLRPQRQPAKDLGDAGQRQLDDDESSPSLTAVNRASVTEPYADPPTVHNTAKSMSPPKTPERALTPDWILSPHKQTYTDALISRLRVLIDLEDTTNGRYTLPKLPAGLCWGTTPNKNDHLLCLGGKPLMVLLIGEVSQAYFVEKDGSPKKFVNVYIKAIRSSDYAAAERLLDSLTTYRGPQDKKKEGVITAGRRQTHRGRNPQERIAYHFKHAYDASRGYGQKSAMPVFAPEDIGYKDVVIVEANVGRFRCHPDDGRAVYDNAPWTTWRASFNIISVCRLYRGSSEPDESDEESDHAGDIML
ncbi:hypothetical protein OH77DRAFT_847453 [Trametes cingulata]|nr:hypothetical protein OH77DRAFT_847453 [Trametes cingulata]